MDNRAIGVFDSGLGGLTAVRQMHRVMPDEHIIYFGDNGRVPYGTRGRDTIIKYTRQDVAFLKSRDIKAIVVACGTVSSVALKTVAAETDIPMIGVVEPACKKAASLTKNGKIGVLGTPGTIRSGSYEKQLLELDRSFSLIARACPLFVPLVENGRFQPDDPVVSLLVEEYLADVRERGIDVLILGCTHYPLLRSAISRYMGDIALIDSGAEAADYAKRVITPSDGSERGTEYYVSDDPENFSQYACMFLQDKSDVRAQLVDIGSY